jgi:hypothetical protein
MTTCIQAKTSTKVNGYFKLMVNRKQVRAHRWVWELINGPIPKGMVVDHVCHNEAVKRGECEGGITCEHRSCVALDHLRLVTQQENVMAGRHNIDNRSHCNQGHPLIKENIMIRKNGKRECAECNRVRARAAYAKKKVGA